MKKHEIFETNPNLKEVHITSDGQAFYNDNDAKMHAKTLEDKKVELVLNPKFLTDIEVIDDEDLSGSDEPKLEDKTKAELVEYAKENFGLELDAKKNTHAQLLIAIDVKSKEVAEVLEVPAATLEVVKETATNTTETLEETDVKDETHAETLEVTDATATANAADDNQDQA